MRSTAASVVATVIGDVVGSRRSPDRQATHDRLREALAAERDAPGVAQPLDVTVGDEFQGTYETVGAAIASAWRVRLALLPDVDVRCGIGWGAVAPLDVDVQDGPGWWDAREAISWVAAEQGRAATAHVRTAYRSAVAGGPDPAAVDAALRCRDHLLGSADARSHRILGGLMTGRTQASIADDEGITPSAVSQRVRADGLEVLRLVAAELAEVGGRR